MITSTHPVSPKVFVSSTVRDLGDLRSAIRYTLNSQGFTVHLSEASDFNVSGERTAIEECFNNIRACDCYILVIGSRRGQLFDARTSITRQEYRVAREQFLMSQRPKLLLYLRKETEDALQSGDQPVQMAGIDYPDHLRSFINEVEHPPNPDAPNFLTRFHSFEDLITSVARNLNIGRNLMETLTRHSLVSELASNLRCMVIRTGTSVFPHHRWMSKLREEIRLNTKPAAVLGQTSLSPNQADLLAAALVGRTRASQLRTRVIEDAVDHGIFLTFNPATGMLQESEIHRSLQETLDDVEALGQLDKTPDSNWESNLLKCISRRPNGTHAPLSAANIDLVYALAHYDRIDNLFNGHVALCEVLMGITEQLEPYQRRPLSLFGEDESRRMRAELVSEKEISHLIRNQVHPFGAKIPSSMSLDNDEQFVQEEAARLRRTSEQYGIHSIPENELMDTVRKSLRSLTAAPEECIDDLSSDESSAW